MTTISQSVGSIVIWMRASRIRPAALKWCQTFFEIYVYVSVFERNYATNESIQHRIIGVVFEIMTCSFTDNFPYVPTYGTDEQGKNDIRGWEHTEHSYTIIFMYRPIWQFDCRTTNLMTVNNKSYCSFSKVTLSNIHKWIGIHWRYQHLFTAFKQKRLYQAKGCHFFVWNIFTFQVNRLFTYFICLVWALLG